MEEVLDLHAAGHSPEEPLTAGEREPIGIAPGQPAEEDYHYRRRGTRAIFLLFDPIRGRRRVSCRDSRTRIDWAEEIRRRLEEDYPRAREVELVCDDPNIHRIASLDEASPAAEAHRLARRLEIHRTPRNGSRLNAAEVELSAPTGQCLDRRIGSPGELASECAAWGARRNAEGARAVWRFTPPDARIELRHLYSQLKT